MNFEIADKSTEVVLTWDEARFYCFSLGADWRLPTSEELKHIYKSTNDFEPVWYWSSTERSSNIVIVHDMYGGFSGGRRYNQSKSQLTRVRAVRDLN